MKPPGGQLCIWFKWLWIPTRDLTDVTLVSEDTDDQDDSDDRDNKMVKKMKRMKKVKKMKTIRRWRRWRINYHYYSDYSQKWARRKFIVFSREWIPYIYILMKILPTESDFWPSFLCSGMSIGWRSKHELKKYNFVPVEIICLQLVFSSSRGWWPGASYRIGRFVKRPMEYKVEPLLEVSTANGGLTLYRIKLWVLSTFFTFKCNNKSDTKFYLFRITANCNPLFDNLMRMLISKYNCQ